MNGQRARHMVATAVGLALLATSLACGEPVDATQAQGLAVLGGGSHDMAQVATSVIVSAAEGMAVPRDLAFDPNAPGDLWIINRADHSFVIVEDVGTAVQTSQKIATTSGEHFFAEPAAIAFGKPGTFATIHESDQATQGGMTPGDFMGPTLFTTNPTFFDGGHGGHLDMLHNSPLGMGIGWERDNVYWVFDGYHSSLSRYDFKSDHGPGGADHSDGSLDRCSGSPVRRLAEVPSHMVFEAASNLMYVADTGNNRIAVLDTTSGSRGAPINPNYDGVPQYMRDGCEIWTLIDGASVGMQAPSGLALVGGILYVTDNLSSTLYAFTLDGELLDFLPTGLPAGSLMGITTDAMGNLYVADAVGQRVMQISPAN